MSITSHPVIVCSALILVLFGLLILAELDNRRLERE